MTDTRQILHRRQTGNDADLDPIRCFLHPFRSLPRSSLREIGLTNDPPPVGLCIVIAAIVRENAMGGPFRLSSSADRDALSAAIERAQQAVREKGAILKAADVPDLDLLPKNALATKARALLAGRRARDRLFGGSGLFGEPAWDILLELFTADVAGKKLILADAAAAAHVAPSTALRWIDKLIQLGLIEREPDHLDRRRHFVTLSDQAEELVRLAITVS